MNKIICALFLLKTVVAFGQGEVKTCRAMLDTLTGLSVHRSATEMAGYPGGIEAMLKQIQKKVYVAKVHGTSGGFKVFVAFIVQSDGTVVGQRVIRNVPGTNLAEQFLDIIDDVCWEPGTCHGKVVATLEILPMEMKTGW